MDRKVQHENLLALDQPFLKVPHEQLHKAFRNTRKYLEKEMTQLTNTMTELTSKTPNLSPQDVVGTLDTCIGRLQQLKRKLVETEQEEVKYVKRLRARIQHLNEFYSISNVDDETFKRWSKTRLDRILVDYLLRSGFHSSAERYASDLGLQELVDTDLFASSRKIEEALKQRSCTECLQWCSDNKGTLRKSNSDLEFNLRVQECVELIRGRKYFDAIQYARRYFPAWASTHLKQIQQVMALLAFPPDTQCQPYKGYYEEGRWVALISQFRRENFGIHNLSSLPLIFVALQAGLSALKTPNCYIDANKNINCPVCAPSLGSLAERLPFSHHTNSCIVCRVTGEIMDENNPPLVLPNGNVYSTKALQDLAKNNGGKVIDPRSGQTYDLSQAKKAFLA